ncbi:MAG: hypothetical protein KA436_06835 [Oligoflexales bacterium]|nr:hypothetical protein [Oligoflexales bacterium]
MRTSMNFYSEIQIVCRRYLCLCFLYLVSCGDGSNLIASKEDPAVSAAKLLEQKKPFQAKIVLLSELGNDYRDVFENIDSDTDLALAEESLHSQMVKRIDNGKSKKAPALVSILASAEAQEGGIDPLEIILNLVKSESSTTKLADSPSLNSLVNLFTALPAATSSRLAHLQKALTVLSSIRSDRFEKHDYFKQAIFTTAYVALTLKFLDTDGDGQISVSEALVLADSLALRLVTLLANAQESINSSQLQSGDENTKASGDKIQEIRDKIGQASGSSDADKLRTFISTTGT